MGLIRLGKARACPCGGRGWGKTTFSTLNIVNIAHTILKEQPMPSSTQYAAEMRNIHKQFGSLVASDNVSFSLQKGQIHALLGENGAGKTTLMRILYGLYHADAGEILVSGQQVNIRSPKDALANGIGMVTQHFALAAPLTVTENIILGHNPGVRLNLQEAARRVEEAAATYGIDVDPWATVGDLSVGEQQRVEILKALYRQVQVLILDEPTAVLVPQEVDRLFATLRNLQELGLSVAFISHKLYEVMAITDHVTVLRGGQVAGSLPTSTTTERALARLMVGREVELTDANLSISEASPPTKPILAMRNVCATGSNGLPAVRDASLDIHAGEIVGIGGVSGNGQVELAQVLDGTRRCNSGSITLDGRQIANLDPVGIMQAGLGRIPEDRHGSVVGDLSVEQNMVLEHLDEFVRHGVLDRQRIRQHAIQLIEEYQIKATPTVAIRTLSGGNMQKVILARVLERNPQAILVSQPTRGLDIGATEYVREKLREQRARGAAILLISEDLDEILALSDRIAILYEGEIMGILLREAATTERLGLMMSGAVRENSAEELQSQVDHGH